MDGFHCFERADCVRKFKGRCQTNSWTGAIRNVGGNRDDFYIYWRLLVVGLLGVFGLLVPSVFAETLCPPYSTDYTIVDLNSVPGVSAPYWGTNTFGWQFE
jgi:hypothetical protein